MAILSIFNAFSQDIAGEWNGAINVMGQELPVVFHIEKSADGFTSSMDSPKQKAFGIVMAETIFANDSLFIKSGLGFSYKGFLTAGKGFSGEFTQNGRMFPLMLGREKIQVSPPNRPQKPQKPYPYLSEDVFFKNEKAEITLAGTLTLPKEKGKFPAVILISGSGPQNRNEELLDHKPFLVLSDYFTRNGIAVLRYDDRGTSESEGNFSTATSADFATDVEAALNYLRTRKEINKDQIGLISHSEGGMIAPMVASKSDKVAFLVLLAGTGIPGDKLLLLQNELIGKAYGMNKAQLEAAKNINRNMYQIVTTSTHVDSLKTKLARFIKINSPSVSETQLQMQVDQISSPWMQFFLKYDPSSTLQKIDVPVLAINGENDLQVPAEVNLNAIETALKKGGNKNVTTKILPGLNHLFQESETGLPAEYGKIEQTFSLVAMELILNWIKTQVN